MLFIASPCSTSYFKTSQGLSYSLQYSCFILTSRRKRIKISMMRYLSVLNDHHTSWSTEHQLMENYLGLWCQIIILFSNSLIHYFIVINALTCIYPYYLFFRFHLGKVLNFWPDDPFYLSLSVLCYFATECLGPSCMYIYLISSLVLLHELGLEGSPDTQDLSPAYCAYLKSHTNLVPPTFSYKCECIRRKHLFN